MSTYDTLKDRPPTIYKPFEFAYSAHIEPTMSYVACNKLSSCWAHIVHQGIGYLCIINANADFQKSLNHTCFAHDGLNLCTKH